MIDPESVAGQRHDLVAEFSVKLDGLVAAWEATIAAQRTPKRQGVPAVPRDPADVLAELERILADVVGQANEHRRIADDEARDAEEWERRAMMSIREGRDDLARQALIQQQKYATAANAAASEAAALEAVRDAFRNAVIAVTSTVRRNDE